MRLRIDLEIAPEYQEVGPFCGNGVRFSLNFGLPSTVDSFKKAAEIMGRFDELGRSIEQDLHPGTAA